MAQQLELALNDNQAHGEALLTTSICRELPPAATAPDWVELLPSGIDVVGSDGRRFVNDDPSRIVSAFNTATRKPMIDWEHASEKQWSGMPAPAAAWMTAFEAREGGAIWAKVDWTPRGAEAVKGREYRYLSPAIMHDREGRIFAIASAGLTNNPNLRLTALNSKESESEYRMDPELLKLLGLPTTATAAQATAAVKALNEAKAHADAELAKATNAAQPSLALFVPRPDYEAALNRANAAEAELEDGKKATLQKEVEAEIDAALKARKITPSQRGFYVGYCQREGGLKEFRELVAASPMHAADSGLEGRDPAKGAAGTALNEMQLEVCRRMGLDPAEYQKSL